MWGRNEVLGWHGCRISDRDLSANFKTLLQTALFLSLDIFYVELLVCADWGSGPLTRHPES
jgi:hypothetical protein